MTLTIEQAVERRSDRGQSFAVKKVCKSGTSFDITGDNGSGFFMGGEHGVVPKVGDIITLYTHRGSLIHGLDLNGEPVYYKTRAEQEEDHHRYVEEQNRRRDEKFEAEREERDAAFDALPPIFKKRIVWFRAHNPRFRQDYEPYEMSACVDAVTLAEWAQEQDGDAGEAIQRFQKLSYEEQRETVPGLAYDRHSGNSFAFAVRLAYHYVTFPENVYEEHGAMVPLVGCQDYGCIHPREES